MHKLDDAVDFVAKGGFKIITLQFPDSLLPDCVSVTRSLKEKLENAGLQNTELHVVADSAYDQTCEDVIAAEHVNSDCLIHFGGDGLSQNAKIPTFHVAPDFLESVDIDNLKLVLQDIEEDITRVFVFVQPSVSISVTEQIKAAFREMRSWDVRLILHGKVIDAGQNKETTGVLPSNVSKLENPLEMRILDEAEEIASPTLFVWIGSFSSDWRKQLQLHNAAAMWLSIDPTDFSTRSGLDNDLEAKIKRRRYLVEKARNADIVGILVSTMSVPWIIESLEGLKRLLREAGRHFYEIVVAKPNPAKLANFPEVGVFVMLCDPHSMILDCKEYLAPVITPYEAQIALSGRLLNPRDYRYHLDPALTTPSNSYMSKDQSVAVRPAGDLIVSDKTSAAAKYFLSKRTFQGLETNQIEDIPDAVEGKKGIASGYEHENSI